MTALPPKDELDGTSSGHDTGVFQAAIGAMRDWAAGLFGELGSIAGAIAGLRVLDPSAVYNISPVFTVGVNALTCTIKDSAGANLSATNPAFVGQRSATAGNGGFNLREMTANVALTISSGSTLGHSSAVASEIYWYLLDNAGVEVLAACGSFQGMSGLYSTTAEGGAGAADSASVIYAAAAHSNLPGRLVAISIDTQATAGTWAAVPSLVKVAPLHVGVATTGNESIAGIKTFTSYPLLPSGTPAGQQAAHAAFVAAAIVATVPIGTILDHAGNSTPSGFLDCNGANVSRVTYVGLFAVLGTIWGAGDGSTTFGLPDARRRVSVGFGGSGTGVLGNSVGNTGGAETHTLTQAELPTNAIVSIGANSDQGASGSTGRGSGSAHNIIQPSMVVQKIIKAY